MTRTIQNRVGLALAALTLAAANTAHAQQALGVPFVGRNHLSFSVTELSRDGIATDRAAVFGGVYGRRISGDNAPLQFTVIARAAARALQGTEDGVVDGGLTLAATRAVPALGALSVTGSAGVGVMVWGENGQNPGVTDRGRSIARAPFDLGVAYDVRVGRATIAPFVTLTRAHSNERDYVNDSEIASNSGWRWGHTAGVSIRFRETVISMSGIHGERGLPNANRLAFTAGMSW